jgi:RNA recognition motif-containing protein
MDVSVRSLWIGDVQPSYTEDMLYPLFASASACASICGLHPRWFCAFLLSSSWAVCFGLTNRVFGLSRATGGPGELISVKFMRDKITGLPVGYGFAEYISQDAASRALAALNGRMIGEFCQGFTLCHTDVAWAHGAVL